jgi:MIP family channel proteins
MNKYFAEMIGTFSLVFVGCGSIVINEISGGMLGHIGVSLTFGLVVMSMIYSVGNVSGAHLNPAVSFGFLATGRLNSREFLFYTVSQIAGAVIAALLLRIIFPEHGNLGSTLPVGGVFQSLAIEIILTFILMFVILSMSDAYSENKIMAGIVIGGTITFTALFGGPVSGASLNPARSLGPAIFSNNIVYMWIYIVGPFTGAFFAYFSYLFLQGRICCLGRVRLNFLLQ